MTTTVDVVDEQRRTFDEQLGEAVHQALWRRRIKQTEFATQVLGITQSALSAKLRGRRPFFAGEISLIAAALGVAAGDLLPTIAVNPPGDDDGGGAGAPTRARTWDLRIKSPVVVPLPVRRIDRTADRHGYEAA